MKELDYCVSAVGMTGITNYSENEIWYPKFKQLTLDLMDVLNRKIKENCSHTNSTISILYNAYTEKRLSQEFAKMDNFGSKYVYSDSGGLQIVTAGKPMNDEIKNDVY